MPNNPKICPMPFTSLHIDADGRIKICCADSPKTIPMDKHGRPFNVTTHKLSDFWNSDYVKSIRKEFIDGKQPYSCRGCFESEINDEQSQTVRTAAINRMNFMKIDYHEIVDDCKEDGHLNLTPIDYQTMVGNLCNLACKMCGPDYSTNYSKFFKSRGFEKMSEIKIHNNSHQVFYESMDSHFGVVHNWPKTIKLSNIFSEYKDDITHIFITGGEPTIVPENTDFLEELSESSNKNNMHLQIATNCTNVNKKLLTTLDKFKSVGIHCSIDGKNEIASIQRTYSDWEQIEKNLKTLVEWSSNSSKEIYVHSVITLMNVHHIMDFWVYLQKLNKDLAISFMPIITKEHPYGLSFIPKRFKSKLLETIENADYIDYFNMVEKFKNHINSINFSDNDEEFFETLDFIQRLHPEYNIKEIYKFYYE